MPSSIGSALIGRFLEEGIQATPILARGCPWLVDRQARPRRWAHAQLGPEAGDHLGPEAHDPQIGRENSATLADDEQRILIANIELLLLEVRRLPQRQPEHIAGEHTGIHSPPEVPRGIGQGLLPDLPLSRREMTGWVKDRARCHGLRTRWRAAGLKGAGHLL